MTEIPEHLLKRSRDRRAAAGGASDSPGTEVATTGDTTPAEAAPAAPAATGPAARTAAAAPAEPPAKAPDSPVVAAYRARRKVPFWAMAALALLPIWTFMYVRSVTAQAEEASGPLAMGAEIYSNCAACHGGGGGGGVGYAFTEGEVLLTFPNIEDQLRYVLYGTGSYNVAGVEIYGDPDRPGGPHVTGARGAMPGFEGALTDYEILSVVCHERYTLGGADPNSDAWGDEFDHWCSEDSEYFYELEEGESLATLHEMLDGMLAVGDGPAPGSSAAAD
ncbi:MAG: c-type cytochrome [Ilumatobacter sp.]